MSFYSVLRAAALALLGMSLFCGKAARADDHMFPAAPAAQSAITYDARGFLVHGKRTFLVSAGMEYARVPRALWRDRLLRLKRAGFNCVEVYNFWNFHEPQEGVFNFSGDHDLNAFLRLVKSLDMYAICRVGPYYCAEWDNGGYPLWLNFKPGVQVREDNPQFEAAVDAFFDKLIPIVAANQINRGGSVVLVQLENEHPLGWGTQEPNPYFTHLRQKALSLGLQVPYFFSGLHHGSDPASDHSMDDPTRPNPWFTTEFWSVWYSQYGPKPGDPATYDRRTWKIIAHGGNGYNYYMAHGGTNFGYTNDNEDAASYDYGAAVGQAGDLRPLYYTFKRAAWFARSFQDILENSTDATADAPVTVTNPDVKVSARTSPAGSITFLDNPGNAPAQTQIVGPDGVKNPSAGPLTLAPGEILPIVQNFPLASVPGVTIAFAPVRIMSIVPQGKTTTIIIYGAPGTPAEMRFSAPPVTRAQAQPLNGEKPLRLAPSKTGGVVLTGEFPSGSTPSECSFTVAGSIRRVRILAVNDALAARTWPVDAGGQTYIVCGPAYVGDALIKSGHLSVTAEQPWPETAPFPTIAYGPGDTPLLLKTAAAPALTHPTALTLSAWQTKTAAEAAAPTYDDSGWNTGDPLPMGADGDLTADAWYRATLQAPADGAYQLQTRTVRDRAEAFVDGRLVPASHSVTLTAGPHTVAIFAAHDGRDKLYNHLGAIDTSDRKGITGPVMLQQGGGADFPLTAWRELKLPASPGRAPTVPAGDAPGWADYAVAADGFASQSGFAWFQTTVPASASASTATLHFESVDDNATVFVNGQAVSRHQGWDQPFDVPTGASWHVGSPNVVTLLVENTAGTGGIGGPAMVSSFVSQTPVTGWKLRGGPGDPFAPAGWAPLSGGAAFDGPQFFRASFTSAPPPAVGPHPIWRVVTTGLGHGNVWVNGHNLGRYPEKIAIDGLYVPECWLVSGPNSLVVYDEDGHRPDAVTVQAETAASRDVLQETAP